MGGEGRGLNVGEREGGGDERVRGRRVTGRDEEG